jgi:hypothetical protein
LSRRFALAINNSASSSQWRTTRKISTDPPLNFNSGRDSPEHVDARQFKRQQQSVREPHQAFLDTTGRSDLPGDFRTS